MGAPCKHAVLQLRSLSLFLLLNSGLGVRLLRKAMGGTGTRLPSVGRKEGGSAGEGEGEDVDEDGEEGEVWEEIPGYLPPLPKAKEENGLLVH